MEEAEVEEEREDRSRREEGNGVGGERDGEIGYISSGMSSPKSAPGSGPISRCAIPVTGYGSLIQPRSRWENEVWIPVVSLI